MVVASEMVTAETIDKVHSYLLHMHLHIHQCEYFLFIARVLVNHLSQLRLGKNLLKSSGIH